MERLGLGLDLGTSSFKATIVNQNGEILAASSSPYKTYSLHLGWREQECGDWVSAINNALGELSDTHPELMKQISLASLTSAAHIGVLLDDDFTPLRKAIIWNDQRSGEQVAKLKGLNGLVERITGNSPSTSWTLPQLLWIKENESEVFSRTKFICLSKDYVIYLLTGRFVTDFATAVSSQLCDVQTGDWSNELCSFIGITRQMLPVIKEASFSECKILDKVSMQYGLPSGIPVYNGTLDSAMETYGARVRSVGDLVIRIGTGGGIHRITKEPLKDYRLLTYPWPIQNLWYSQAGTNAAGQAIAWATSALGFPLNSHGFDDFDHLAKMAMPSDGNVLFFPYLNGERTPYWNSTLRATFSGITLQTSRAQIARSVLEGVAFSLFDAYQTINGNGENPKVLMAVGGGTKDTLLMKIMSSVFDIPIIAQSHVDSSYGTALFALACEGKTYESNDGIEWYKPQGEWISLYHKAFETYKLRVQNLLTMYQHG